MPVCEALDARLAGGGGAPCRYGTLLRASEPPLRRIRKPVRSYETVWHARRFRRMWWGMVAGTMWRLATSIGADCRTGKHPLQRLAAAASFREVKNENRVVLVTLEEGKAPDIEPVYVPRFSDGKVPEGEACGRNLRCYGTRREEPGA